VTRSTLEGRTTTYEAADLASGVVRREVTDPAGLVTRSDRGTNDAVSTTTPEGTVSTTVEGPDPRFGMQAPVLTNLSVAIPGGLTSTVTGSRQITGFSGSHPLGIAGVEERVTVNGRQYVSSFDALANRFTDVTPMGRQTITRVDSAGRPLAVRVAGLDSVVYGYDVRGRLATSRQGGRQWSYAYDDSGRLERITDPLSRVTEFGYDAGDRLVRQVLPDLREIRYGYDANGNLTSLTPPGRPNHGFDYTAVDLTERYAPPDVGLPEERTTYAYNRDRQLEAITRPDGVVVDLGYDAAGRLSSVAIPRGTIGFGYSPTTGNLTSLSSPDGVSLSYSYNGSLPTSESWSGAVAGSVSLTYDNNLRPVSQSVNGGNTMSFGYDNDGLLTAAGALTLARNTANGLLTGTTLSSVTTSQSYTSAGELATFEARYAGSTLFASGYDRDSLGRITRLTETLQGTTTVFDYGYDPAGRLETVRTNGALTHQYGYDANGNRLSFVGAAPADTATGAYDAQDRLLRYGNAVFAYTANGELRLQALGADTTWYTYDQLGNLVTVELPSGDRIDYLIDGQNRRVAKQLNGTLVRAWLYQNGLNPVAELDGTGALVSRFVYGSKGHVPDYLMRGGQTYRLVTDHLGSVRLVVEVGTGAIAQRVEYDAWGNVLLDTNPGLQPFGFAGGLWEPATGLVRFGARDYDAEVGRWTSKDPILFSGRDLDLYAYVSNKPVGLIDPTGLLFGGLIDAGEDYGSRSAQYWAEVSIQSDLWYQRTGATLLGLFASLWTPCTSDATFAVLTAAAGVGQYLGRPFWRYIGPNSRPDGRWLTRGPGSNPPYGRNFDLARDQLQLPGRPADVVRAPSRWNEFIHGPRTVSGNPQYGGGGGVEYFRGWSWPK
jgi:RHS repeat-associated protein